MPTRAGGYAHLDAIYANRPHPLCDAAQANQLPLVEHFLRGHSAHYGKGLSGFTDEAASALRRHAWPGNVRELEHAIERAVLMAQGGMVDAVDLGLRPRGEGGSSSLESLTLEEAERHLIERALERHGGNVSKAADALGLSRSALYRRLQQYGL